MSDFYNQPHSPCHKLAYFINEQPRTEEKNKIMYNLNKFFLNVNLSVVVLNRNPPKDKNTNSSTEVSETVETNNNKNLWTLWTFPQHPIPFLRSLWPEEDSLLSSEWCSLFRVEVLSHSRRRWSATPSFTLELSQLSSFRLEATLVVSTSGLTEIEARCQECLQQGYLHLRLQDPHLPELYPQ